MRTRIARERREIVGIITNVKNEYICAHIIINNNNSDKNNVKSNIYIIWTVIMI